jgi:serine/threonine protein kinase
MHDLELAHRDVNTHNILVTSTWHVVLIDLGLAISVQSGDCECRQGKVVGTMGYIPPEVYQGGCCGVKGDMWAIGVVLYESLFGFKPFNNPAETMGIPLEFPDPSWGMDCSAEATDLMEKLLRKDESKRASAVEALFSQWFTIADFQVPACTLERNTNPPCIYIYIYMYASFVNNYTLRTLQRPPCTNVYIYMHAS